MANSLDEVTGPVNESGRDIHIIDKQLPVSIGTGSTIFSNSFMGCNPHFSTIMCSPYGKYNS